MATTYEQILGIEGNPKQRKPIVSPIPAIDPSIGGQSGKAGPTSPPTIQSQTPSQIKPTQQSESPAPAQQPEQPQQRLLSYEEMFRILNPEKPETPEEKAKREKKEKREAVFSALGDGISALANLYFTTKGAPNAYDPTQGMSAKARERWDKLKALRDSKDRAYNEGLLRAMQLDDANRKGERNWRHTIERERISDQYRETKEKRDEAKAAMDSQMAEAKLALQLGKLDYQTYLNEIARIKAQNQDALSQSQISKNNRFNTGRSSGGGGKPGEYPWYDAEGNIHYAHSYEAMRQNAINAGTWSEATQTSTTTRTTTDKRGKKSTSTSTNTKPAKGSSKKPEKETNQPQEKKEDKKWSNTSNLKW